jgi:inorganic pyrophosphatase
VTSRPGAGHPLSRLGPFDDRDRVNVVVDTPKGSRNKYTFDEKRGVFALGGVLPAGAFFPFDFGYVPGTKGGDGDPVDVLVLMDEPAFPGCVIPARLIGVIEAEQTERGGATVENDRLIAVADNSWAHRDIESLDDVPDRLLEEIEHFFVSYNASKHKTFTPKGRHGPKRARRIVEGAVVKRTGKRKEEGRTTKN